MPLLAEASAVIVILAGAVKIAPLAGLVIPTVGGEPTVMFTGFELVIAPRLSIAFAVSAYLPDQNCDWRRRKLADAVNSFLETPRYDLAVRRFGHSRFCQRTLERGHSRTP